MEKVHAITFRSEMTLELTKRVVAKPLEKQKVAKAQPTKPLLAKPYMP